MGLDQQIGAIVVMKSSDSELSVSTCICDREEDKSRCLVETFRNNMLLDDLLETGDFSPQQLEKALDDECCTCSDSDTCDKCEVETCLNMCFELQQELDDDPEVDSYEFYYESW